MLWLRELGRLFGVTAHAAAATLAVFFLGLSAGSYFWGQRAARTPNPLRTYGLLEIGIAASALLYFLILRLYQAAYSPLFETFGDRPAVFLGVKFALASGALFLPAFCMGGTLPMMGQFLIRSADQLGRKASLLYAVNTVGAAIGALLAGFYLPIALGFRNSYLVAVSVNLLIAAVALVWSRGEPAAPAAETRETPPREAPSTTSDLVPRLVRLIALVSGFATLALEVLWVRMYAQVLQNSVYTFAAILAVFLFALGCGSAIANLLCRARWSPRRVLFWLLTLSGLLVGLLPALFFEMTDGLRLVAGESGWSSYILRVFGLIAAGVLVPGAVIGSVFPYLMKVSEGWATGTGKVIGQLASINTAGAIAGSLAAGFLLLDWLGLWDSVRAMAFLYLALALGVLPRRRHAAARLAAVPIALALLFGSVVTYSSYANVQVDVESGEEVLETWEGSYGTVAVVKRGDDLGIKLNNHYALGGSQSAVQHRRQSWLPLALHPEPRSAFYLGMGTGITAGAAVDFDLESVVVSELSPDVVEAARVHFEPYLNGLFGDPRVEIVREDGRNHLFGTRRSYDVIIADLFLTWKAGAGSLYSREHFVAAARRLAPGGLFVQWLPLAQLTAQEFGIIARTVLEVFPHVTVWRRGYSLKTPAAALIARNEPGELPASSFRRRIEGLVAAGDVDYNSWLSQVPFAAYAGNLTAAAPLFESYPLNTDDRPLVEYLSPINNRNEAAGGTRTLRQELDTFYGRLFDHLAPEDDPYLSGLAPSELDQVRAGLSFLRYQLARQAGDASSATRHLHEFQRLSGTGVRAGGPGSG